MVYKDYYKILALESSRVTTEEIKNAYRTAAKKYHPDVNITDHLAEERIKDINEAYRVLSNSTTKRKYDRVWNSRNNIKNYSNIKGKNIVNMFLGNREDVSFSKTTDKNLAVKGENIQTEINVKLEDAFYGTEKTISLKASKGKTKNYDVKIPEGIRNGEKIRLIGQGQKGKNGGKNGDLYIKINIDSNDKFRLIGSDLHTDLLISPWEAALGTKIEINTIDDVAKVYIPQGTQSGEILKIPNKGYKNVDGTRGDLVAEVKIMVPKRLELNEKEAFEKLSEMSNFNPRK